MAEKFRNKICKSVHVALLLVLVTCLNSSTFGDSLNWVPLPSTSLPSLPPDPTWGFIPQPHLDDTDINILFLSISNDLPPGSGQLYFICNFQKTYLLEPGKPYTKLTNFEHKFCSMTWKSTLYASFDAYDPSQEGSHQRIFWSARKDGVYHSWDQANWDRRATWEFHG